MACTVDPTPEEVAESNAFYRRVTQKAAAYDEMYQNWLVFQQELCEFLTAYNGDLTTMSQLPTLREKYPNLTDWMRQHAEADQARRQRQAMLEEVAVKLSELDDATLAEMGFKRV